MGGDLNTLWSVTPQLQQRTSGHYSHWDRKQCRLLRQLAARHQLVNLNGTGANSKYTYKHGSDSYSVIDHLLVSNSLVQGKHVGGFWTEQGAIPNGSDHKPLWAAVDIETSL